MTRRLERAILLFSWDRVHQTEGKTIERDLREARDALAAASRVAF